jgi:ATP-binding cassette subfamily C protein
MLAAQLRPYHRPITALAVLSGLLAAPTALSGLIIRRALDDGFLVQRPLRGLFWLAVFAQVTLAAGAANRALFPLLARIAEPFRDHLISGIVTTGLRRATADDVAGTVGASVLQATEEAEMARSLVASILRNIHNTISVAAGAVAGLAVLDPAAALIVAACLLAAAALYQQTVRVTLRRLRRALLAEEDLAEQASQVFISRRDILSCTAGEAAAGQVQAAIEATRQASLSVTRAGLLRALTIGLGVELATVMMLALAPWLIAAHRLDTGGLIAAVYYLMMSLGPAIRFLVTGGGGWAVDLLAVMGRLGDAVDSGPAPEAALPPVRLPRDPGLELDTVSFAYSASAAPVLDRVCGQIRHGTHLAVVGPSGAGKSTLASLLAGLREPDSGRVSVGGVSLGDLPRTQRTSLIALVPQEAYVFAGTVRENLRYLAPDTPDHAVREAAASFGLAGVMDRLGGLDAMLAAGGAGLAAGEKQLITLIRVYLSGARIVILDEASSHLDPATEDLAESLLRRRGGTLIVIAHRISSAQRAELVLLVDGGRLSGGTHDELLRSSARYRELAGYWETGQAAPSRHAAPHVLHGDDMTAPPPRLNHQTPLGLPGKPPRLRLQRRVVLLGAACLAILILATNVISYQFVHHSSAPIPGVRFFRIPSRLHVKTPVRYAQTPPVGGPHDPVWLNCGIYQAPVRNENAVHSMEHGAVWITYRPGLAAAQLSILRQDVRRQPSYMLLSPYPGLPAPVVGSAWGVQLRLSNAADPRLEEFIARYRAGPQAPEPGAPCVGGTGTPLR